MKHRIGFLERFKRRAWHVLGQVLAQAWSPALALGVACMHARPHACHRAGQACLWPPRAGCAAGAAMLALVKGRDGGLKGGE